MQNCNVPMSHDHACLPIPSSSERASFLSNDFRSTPIRSKELLSHDLNAMPLLRMKNSPELRRQTASVLELFALSITPFHQNHIHEDQFSD